MCVALALNENITCCQGEKEKVKVVFHDTILAFLQLKYVF